ncbi:50S ribosomal protein L29 [Candidatus Giovannonibacteria bacterium RIFCSPHIGHO2_01_FULL_45_24]|uniref:Large ribosomal subunit protein uL29 n=1 Tax=Candidatus Giovannonibacteria bacterium RIFCSPLOWO2_01_FULL_46_32 TaxID=1798353 RepID=A0A1F5XHT9_9BACT|nr:MAG: 50S ribosomal protein L29 [Candidatus Giovannonibacteria bacterium RIFCSPHIGHO2_01_FULL_45_24]OGF87449.1 MAG: 50S ribosomal protein L29 [Candidatus Giovannonibacteria bacterium RIFCSPLOWO2_01_FULL_46_32]
MTRIKIKDLRSKAELELGELLAGEREKLLELNMRAHESKPKNVKEAREIRKNIARILTLLKNKN